MTCAPIMSREQRLTWARGILADREGQSDARLRRACLTVLNHSSSSETAEREAASTLLKSLQP